MVKLKMLWLWALVLVAMVACEQTRDVPPRIATPVTDNAGVLSDADEATLATRLAAHRQRTGVQVALLTITTLNGEPIEDFSHRTAVAWGGGSRERNDGVLVTLVIRDHRSRIEVGYGLEAELSDGRTRGMLDGARPFLRRSDYTGAFGSILDGIEARTAGRRASGDGLFVGAPQSSVDTGATVTAAPPQSADGGLVIALICLGAVVITGMLTWVLVRMDRRREREARAYELETVRESRAIRVREEQARRDREARLRAREALESRERERREREAREATPEDVSPPEASSTSTYETPTSEPGSLSASHTAAEQSVRDAARAALREERRAEERRAEERRAEERRAEERRAEEQRAAAARKHRQGGKAASRRASSSSGWNSKSSSSSSDSSSSWSSDSSSSWSSDSSSSSSSSDSSSSWGGGGGDFGGGGSSSGW